MADLTAFLAASMIVVLLYKMKMVSTSSNFKPLVGCYLMDVINMTSRDERGMISLPANTAFPAPSKVSFLRQGNRSPIIVLQHACNFKRSNVHRKRQSHVRSLNTWTSAGWSLPQLHYYSVDYPIEKSVSSSHHVMSTLHFPYLLHQCLTGLGHPWHEQPRRG